MEKQYIVFNNHHEGHLVSMVDLQMWLDDGSIEEGDQVYEVKLFNIAKKMTRIYLDTITDDTKP